jgi:hypothetical protein
MHRRTRLIASALGVGVLVLGGSVTASTAASGSATKTRDVSFELVPSSAQIAACMPGVKVNVEVDLTTDEKGFDVFEIEGKNLRPNTAFTVFLIQQAGAPFGAAEYIGDFTSNRGGQASNKFRLIVQEAFSSTIVNGQRVRVDLNSVGVWFADPADDEACVPGSGPTPFDGDNEAGVQAFNSDGHFLPLP